MPKLLSHIADRQQEIDLFSHLLLERNQGQILLISGEGGMGKTSLLRVFVNICHERNILNSIFSFRLPTSGPIEVMLHLSQGLGWANFGEFREELTSINPQLSTKSEQGVTSGIHIELALSGFDIEERQARLSIITNAFFTDLRALLLQTQTVACFFDDIEIAGPITQDWLCNSFLESAYHTSGTVVVLAGRQVPELNREWKNSVIHHRLDSIRNVEDWIEYQKEIAPILEIETIRMFCKASEGRPLEIAMMLSKLVSERG